MSFNLESGAKTKRNTFIIVVAAIFLAAIFCVNALFSVYLLRQNSIQDHSEELSNLTVILAEHTSQILFSANTALDSIVDVMRLEKISTEKAYIDFASKKNQFDLLKDKTRSNSVIDVSTFVANDGKVLNFSRSYPPPDINLSERDYFQYLSTHNDQSTFYSAPVRNKGNNSWVFYLARRINGPGEKFLGIVLVGVSVEVFSTLYERIAKNLGEGAAISLYRKDKLLLTRWPLVAEMLGKVNTNTFIDQSLENAHINNGIIFASGTGFSRGNENPVQRMISYRAVDGYPFIVGAVFPESVYLEGWGKNTSGVILATAISLITLFSGAYLLISVNRKNAENQFRAHHDQLTGLPNRILLSDRLQNAITICKRNQEMMAVMFVDLDNLKKINDSYSHTVGDAAIKEVSARIKKSLRDSDTVARLGGDEFVAILPNIGSEENVEKIAEKVRRALLRPLKIDKDLISTSASIGVAIYPHHGQNEADLLNNADFAMYEAKSSGKNAIRIFGLSANTSILHDVI